MGVKRDAKGQVLLFAAEGRQIALPDIDWIELPPGRFTLGATHEPVKVPAFRLSRHAVTVEQFEAFVTAGGWPARGIAPGSPSTCLRGTSLATRPMPRACAAPTPSGRSSSRGRKQGAAVQLAPERKGD